MARSTAATVWAAIAALVGDALEKAAADRPVK